jgi:hypothetical protein
MLTAWEVYETSFNHAAVTQNTRLCKEPVI